MSTVSRSGGLKTPQRRRPSWPVTHSNRQHRWSGIGNPVAGWSHDRDLLASSRSVHVYGCTGTESDAKRMTEPCWLAKLDFDARKEAWTLTYIDLCVCVYLNDTCTAAQDFLKVTDKSTEITRLPKPISAELRNTVDPNGRRPLNGYAQRTHKSIRTHIVIIFKYSNIYSVGGNHLTGRHCDTLHCCILHMIGKVFSSWLMAPVV